MSSGPPRKPPGAPPGPPGAPAGRPPAVSGAVRGVGAMNARGPPGAPPGAPPSGPPVSQLKPPPMAPPRAPGASQRPPVESIRGIEAPRPGMQPKAASPAGAPPSSAGARGPPPRGPIPVGADSMDTDVDGDGMESTGGGFRMQGMAAPKFSAGTRPAPMPKKPGAIAMFKPEEPSIEPADKKMKLADGQAGMARTPRPAPPRPGPPGIPTGQPLPPKEAPDKETKPPAPTKPAPARNRAPPRETPKVDANGRPTERIVAPDAPGGPPPFLRGVKPPEPEPPFVPRRERENPEFESSSEEEEGEEPKVKVDKDPFAHIVLRRDDDEEEPPKEPEPVPPKPKSKAPAAKPQAPSAPTTPAAGAGEGAGADKIRVREIKGAGVTDDDFAEIDVDATTAQLGTGAVSVADTFETASDIGSVKSNVTGATAVAPIGMPPSGNVADNIMSSYVPPPPAAFVPQAVDSTLARDLASGRFSVKCIEGMDIRRKDDMSANPRTDPFIKFKLGAAERFPWQATSIRRKQDQNPDFGGEVVAFNVLDPGQYVFLDDVQLTIEVWNKSPFKDELMGAVTMSIVRILKAPFALFKETVPLFLPGQKSSNSKLSLEFVFEEARAGMFVITLFEAHGLRNLDPMGSQSPFVNFSVGPSYSKRGKVVKNGGTDPYFTEEEVLIWADSENWVHDLHFSICDESVGVDKPIASSYLSMLPYMNQVPDEARPDEFDLFYTIQTDPKDDREKREVASGMLVMRVVFLQAGKLTAHCTKGKNLQFPEGYTSQGGDSRLDPYCSLTLDGQAVKMVKRTPADKDGGHDPVWAHDVKFDVVDQYQLLMNVFHQNMQGNDVLLGYTEISLLPIFRNGRSEFWVTLKQQKLTGGIIEVGAVHLNFTFTGMSGVHFPRHRTGVDTFDDTVRKLPAPVPDVEADDVIEVKPEISTIPEEVSPKKGGGSVASSPSKASAAPTGPPPPGLGDEEPPEFTDEEIIAAFKFIDLDHNNFVGASEIRHILICMGEMITDEEIDTMISMVDVDGDGQVSFQEFRTLILHPNPAEANLTKEIGLVEEQASNLEKQALAGKHVGLDLTAFQRQKEMVAREGRKKMLIGFVADNEVDFDFIKHAYSRYVSLPKEKRKNGRVDFEAFCQVVDVEPISEYKLVHALFDTEEKGDMDFREFLLSLMNFVEVDREIRVRFSFQMFDEGKTGFVSIKEVEEILRGNHMIALASVQRKAQTIMKQASTNASGFITCNEFVVVSKKFPNILLPVFNVAALRSK